MDIMRKIIRNNRTNMPDLLVDESIFAVQNGYLGVRGNFVEGYSALSPKQTLINGFYGIYDYSYEENSPCFPQTGQKIINVIDGQSIDFEVRSTLINSESCELIDLQREFDLEKGFTIREATYKTREGFHFVIREEKFASFETKELLVIKVSITSPDYTGPLKISSYLRLPLSTSTDALDPRIRSSLEDELILKESFVEEDFAYVNCITSHGHLSMAAGMTHSQPFLYRRSHSGVQGIYETNVVPKKSISLVKYVVYTTSMLYHDVMDSNRTILKSVKRHDYDYHLQTQIDHMWRFWRNALATINGDDLLNSMLQYAIYQLNASATENARFNIGAKGLTGEGYEGHYFWDTEIYMIPFFTLTCPEKAKVLLMNRYLRFPEAKEEAMKLGIDKGVKIPWRTINGNEASPYFLAGSAQLHINSDLAYAIIQYYHVSNDYQFMIDIGFEMLVETGRFIYHSGHFYEGSFHLNGVTGPDEYTTLVDDNYYTNSMAQYHLNYINKFYTENKSQLSSVIKKIAISENEIDAFAKAAKAMTILTDKKTGITAQDASFMQKAKLDLKKLPPDKFPMLLHYHPLFIYKHQILKQADVLLSMFLLDYEDERIIRKNFKYYLPLTTHDSSLSKCIHSIVASRIGEKDIAFDYLLEVFKIDFENTHGNTNHGLHIANLGGTYLAMVFGLLGLRIHENGLTVRPIRPTGLPGYSIQIMYHGNQVTFTVDDKLHITADLPITLGIFNDLVTIENQYHCDYK
jgi:alpha,alpha-trehalose phosphorylase